jgi:hypothetical protein
MAALMKEMGVLSSSDGEVKINDTERIKLERIAHNVGSEEIKNLKTILDYLGVRWLEAPETFEGEHIGAIRTWEFDTPDGKHCPQYVDCVITNDADALLYGARAVIKRSGFGKTAVYMYYEINDLLARYSLTYVEFMEVCLCLGTDAMPAGVKGIGKKTVLQKFKKVDYTPYYPIMQMYGRRIDTSGIVVHNKDQPYMTDAQKEALLRWLVDRHGFNEERQRKILFKA